MDLNMSSDSQRMIDKLNLLALLLNFEKYWQCYCLSDGALYSYEVRAEAEKIKTLFYKIYGKKVLINSDRTLNDDGFFKERQFVEELDNWLATEDKFPKAFLGATFTNSTTFYYQIVLMEFERRLSIETNLPVNLSFSAIPHIPYFKVKQLKWSTQIPETIVDKVSDPSYMQNMSESDTLVIVGDIRRSQDLLTYGMSPNFYREQIINFLTEVRKILRDNYAIYDRFTGDGFVAYLNEFVCKQNHADYYSMMLDACRRIQAFASDFFDKWAKQIRKIPCEGIGLSIGVDSGKVSFKEVNEELFAIGDACVWATRMCNVGKKGDVILNNIPYHRICGFGNTNFSKELDSVTKNGEEFRAFRVDLNQISYKPNPQKDPSLDTPSAIS